MSFLLAVALLHGSAAAHQGHGHAAAWRVCADAEVGEICSFDTEAHERHVGTCRAMSGEKVCVRNRPIEPVPPAQAVPGAGALIALSFLALFVAGAFLGFLRSRRGAPSST